MPRDLDSLAARFSDFNRAREWGQFHTPKNALLSLVSEVGELAEHMRWREGEELATYIKNPASREQVTLELGDVFLNVLLLSQTLGIDLIDAGEASLAKNAQNYFEDAARGQHDKLKDGKAA